MHTLVLLVLLGVAFGAPYRTSADEPEPRKDTVVTISRETTVLTEPLDEEGYVDLLAAVNQRLSEGVTPENNAVVPLRIAMGLFEQREHDEYRDEFDRMLGIEPGRYGLFVQLTDVAAKLGVEDANAAYEELAAAHERPWVAEEHPIIAGWLLANEPALEMISEATRRPRFYAPYIAGDVSPALIAVLLPVLQDTREAARALVAHALMCAGEEKLDQAIESLEATHRLARLTSQDPTIIGGLVAIAIDSMASHADIAVVTSGGLTREQLTEYLQRLNHLPSMPGMAERVDRMERLMFVDVVVSIARGRADDQLLALAGVGRGSLWEMIRQFTRNQIDWDATLRAGHQWYDRVVAAMQKDSFTEQQDALSAIDSEIQSLGANGTNPIRVAGLVFADSKTRARLLGKQIGEVLVSALLPATKAATAAEHRGQMTLDLTRLAIALEIHRLETGEYPESLDVLAAATDVLKRIPQDRFTGGVLHYERADGGYVLSSVGVNGNSLSIRVPRGE